jgi:hypothetical protein
MHVTARPVSNDRPANVAPGVTTARGVAFISPTQPSRGEARTTQTTSTRPATRAAPAAASNAPLTATVPNPSQPPRTLAPRAGGA